VGEMEKKEVAKLLDYVKAAYPMFVKDNNPAIIMDLWTRALKDYEYEAVFNNFMDYATRNEFPPKVSELLKNVSVKSSSYNIPDVAATKELLKKYEPAPESERLTPEQAKALVYEKLGWRV
jgi:hypothetical protein